MTPHHTGAAMREPFPYVIDPGHRAPLPAGLPAELWELYANGFQTFDAEPGDHILGRDLAVDGFDPNQWIRELEAAGGGVWFSMALSMSPDGDLLTAIPVWLQLREPADAEARRAAIFRAMVLREAVRILRGDDAIGPRPAVVS
ncbi:hypothetical protein [Brevundimonas sp.]|uniref:hypothetical protein n=1 Tax=Brevundimonas sp. TaxID=1871086 RepID=UPI00286B2BEC|nr:hypothetical protein [Brevundimonas sp.]